MSTFQISKPERAVVATIISSNQRDSHVNSSFAERGRADFLTAQLFRHFKNGLAKKNSNGSSIRGKGISIISHHTRRRQRCRKATAFSSIFLDPFETRTQVIWEPRKRFQQHRVLSRSCAEWNECRDTRETQKT